jgi:hypothetical protein
MKRDTWQKEDGSTKGRIRIQCPFTVYLHMTGFAAIDRWDINNVIQVIILFIESQSQTDSFMEEFGNSLHYLRVNNPLSSEEIIVEMKKMAFFLKETLHLTKGSVTFISKILIKNVMVVSFKYVLNNKKN